MASQDSKRDNNSRLSSFNKEIEQGINEHINRQYQAWYDYVNISVQCKNDRIALHGFAEYFCIAATRAQTAACSFMRYQTQRGGVVNLKEIKSPKDNWTGAIESWKTALCIQKELAEDLTRLVQTGTKHNDRAFVNWVESNFLQTGTRHVKDAADILRQVERVEGTRSGRGGDSRRESGEEASAGRGIYELDREFRENGGKPRFSNHSTEPLDILHEIEISKQQRECGNRCPVKNTDLYNTIRNTMRNTRF
jgi:ferritin